MTRIPHLVIAAAFGAAVLLPASAAQAQYYGATAPAPLYPYAAQPGQPYAVEVAPNTYVIQRPTPARSYPYVRAERKGNVIVRAEREPDAQPAPKRFDRPPKKNDPALIEELRERHVKKTVTNTKKVVIDPPVVIETKRYVDDPPRVIERRHYVETDAPAPSKRRGLLQPPERSAKQGKRDDNEKRVIEADAEVTILGPDRMSIRLFRKGQRGANAKAEAE